MVRHHDGTTGLPHLYDENFQPTARYDYLKKYVTAFFKNEQKRPRSVNDLIAEKSYKRNYSMSSKEIV